MARFERSRERRSKRDSRDRRSNRGGSSFEEYSRGFGRESSRHGRRRDLEMTKVTCSSCNTECEVPFKPTSNKPVYCSDCFKDKGRQSGSSNLSNRDLDLINEKLDKILSVLESDVEKPKKKTRKKKS